MRNYTLQEPKNILKGEIKSVIFSNEENGYAVLRLKTRRKNIIREVIACGNMYQPFPGEQIMLEGKWEHNKQYGFQFIFFHFERKVPQSKEGMVKYLSSNMVKGIGKYYAEEIIEKFGENALSIIENEPERLMEISGIGEKRVAGIKQSWKTQKIIRDIILFLSKHGINLNYASKIYKAFGEDSIEQLKRDPYILAEKIRGIGFKTADSIAKKLHIKEDSYSRIKSGIVYILMNDTENGNTMTLENTLLDGAQELLGVEQNKIESCLKRLLEEEGVFQVMKDNSIYYSIPAFFFAEIKVSHRLNNILNSRFYIGIRSIDSALNWVQSRINIELTENQKQAIAGVINNKISIITGGPGTGKTTIVKAIHLIYKAKKARIALLSPTGKAAKRMSEVTSCPASTIHRILGSNPQTNKNVKNEMNKLQYDIIIIDEFSMVDILLFHNLLKAIEEHTKLILIGDADQLPSVGPGDVLHNMIRSGIIFTAELNQIFRQKRTSRIITAAHRIKDGEFPYLPMYKVDDRNDLYLYPVDDRAQKNISPADENRDMKDDIPGIIIKMIKYDIPRMTKFSKLDEIQVLTSMNKGICGTHNLNCVLQDYFNPDGRSVKRYGKVFKVNDKIMQTSNNYDKLVFNGDSGIITNIDPEEKILYARFDNRTIEYAFDDLDELTLSYAISVHKSQGSEFPVIIFPIIMSHYIMLRRNLIYTGITRAKKLAIILGSKRAIGVAVKKGDLQERSTYLTERIMENIKKIC